MDPSPPKPHVCRQLFPSTEPPNDDYQIALEESLQKRLEEQKKKWNFDFSRDEMISNDGTYIWTEGDGERYDLIGRPNNLTTETENTKDVEENAAPKANVEDQTDESNVES